MPKKVRLMISNAEYTQIMQAIASFYEMYEWVPSPRQVRDMGFTNKDMDKIEFVYDMAVSQKLISEPGKISGRSHLTDRGDLWMKRLVRDAKKLREDSENESNTDSDSGIMVD